MWQLRHCPLNDEQLGLAVGLSGNAARNRRAKPELWKLTDIGTLADHFSSPSKSSVQLGIALSELPAFLKGLSAEERRQFERLLTLKLNQIETFNRSDWPLHHLLRMHTNLLASTLCSVM